MRLRVACSSLLSLCLILLPVSAQQTTQSAMAAPQRDAQSVATLNKAVSAMGGNASLQSAAIVAHGNSAVPPAGISGPILWETQGSEFRFERPGANGTIVFVSGHGNPAIAAGGTVQRNVGHLAMVTFPAHLPAVVLVAQLNSTKVEISPAQQVSLNGAPAIKVALRDLTDEVSSVICKQDWYLDSTTLLPFRVDYLASEASNALDTAKMTVLLSDYRPVSGMQIPFRIVTLFEGQQISDVTLTSVQLNASVPASDFDVTTVSGSAQ